MTELTGHLDHLIRDGPLQVQARRPSTDLQALPPWRHARASLARAFHTVRSKTAQHSSHVGVKQWTTPSEMALQAAQAGRAGRRRGKNACIEKDEARELSGRQIHTELLRPLSRGGEDCAFCATLRSRNVLSMGSNSAPVTGKAAACRLGQLRAASGQEVGDPAAAARRERHDARKGTTASRESDARQRVSHARHSRRLDNTAAFRLTVTQVDARHLA